ncbi:inositol monophosphatase [Methanofollis liminatans DSM 4140]|jgi:myo-inositol-1(or 4)-monophosphatase|uniref:fructose-bisphosphatase n=1 Tax=Methanofollis liminatans DSM 4140 TaxID=28892 RepID=J1L280_9EURY|nr:bifunctional fructose-bisphosphatase/inositol-phosphate phosphatase [Methanofollis liminatans]EJG07152.1 inositol monophosphatase [Methanofollis liminatans DSM 4140]
MDFIKWCGDLADQVGETVKDLVDSPEGAQYIRMGADGTPTERIDQAAEECVVAALRENPFCSRLISEELGIVDIGGEKGTVYLDPIDGTYNAVHGIPFYTISIAYGEDGTLQQGFVRDLCNGETFSAVRGRGAYLDGRPIRVSKTALLEESALSIYGRKFDPSTVLPLGEKVRRWRLLGASSLELAYVACGRLDGFVDTRNTLRVIDAAAGIVLCEAAGGKVSGVDGLPVKFSDDVRTGRCLIATNAVLHTKIIEYLR